MILKPTNKLFIVSDFMNNTKHFLSVLSGKKSTLLFQLPLNNLHLTRKHVFANIKHQFLQKLLDHIIASGISKSVPTEKPISAKSICSLSGRLMRKVTSSMIA